MAIRELHEQYGDAVRRHNADEWILCWAEDATWAYRGGEITGRDAIRARWIQAMEAYKFINFLTQPGATIVSGNRATVRCHTIEFMQPVEGPDRWQFGQYDDELIKTNGIWLYQKRTFTVRATAAAPPL